MHRTSSGPGVSIFTHSASLPSLRHPGNAALPAGTIYPGGKDIRTPSWRLPPDGPSRTAHAVKVAKPWNAESTERGWVKREAAVSLSRGACRAGEMPTAGVMPAGEIDNTYTPAPASVAWGKTRALSKMEKRPKPAPQVTDLMVGVQPHRQPGFETMKPMTSVREPFAPSPAILVDKVSPFRFESGFIATPIVSRGTSPPRLSPLRGRPHVENTQYWRSNKLIHACSMHDLKIPVNKIWK